MPNNLTDAEENRLLDLSALDTDKLALTSVPGTDSAAGTEVTGGSYARQTTTWAAAASGSKSTSATLTFSDMPAGDVLGWALWNSGGTSRKWYGLFSPKSGTAQNTGETITFTAHGYTNGQKVVFQDGYTPAGLTSNTAYFVVGATANTFQVSTTSGGAAVNITADSSLVVFGKVFTLGAGEAFQINSGQITLSLS